MTTTDTTPANALRGVSKTFTLGSNAVHAVRDVDLTSAAGESAAIVGPSGSGKTRLGSARLSSRADHVPSGLSGGEQQRVAIARALASEPHVLLADEPTGNLGSATGAEIIELLLSLSAVGRRTVVVVTHELAIAGRVGRVVRVQDGRLPPAE